MDDLRPDVEDKVTTAEYDSNWQKIQILLCIKIYYDESSFFDEINYWTWGDCLSENIVNATSKLKVNMMDIMGSPRIMLLIDWLIDWLTAVRHIST